MRRLLAALFAIQGAQAYVCEPCHREIVASYRQSAMGRSLGVPSPASARFQHAASGSAFDVRGLTHRLERGGLAAEHRVAWRIGSGNHASGFLVRVRGEFYQSPVAHYTARKLWDVAPGYEKMARPDFNRRVTAECLDCHSSGPVDALEPIGCEKCHGPADAHLAKPGRGTIRNPRGVQAVCERCHLTGEARVGDTVYVYDRPRSDLRVVSHVEQLALSKCNVWCGTCHDAHGRRVDISARCRECHARVPDGHAAYTECTSCHMPKRAASDGGHTAFTDHRIQRRAVPAVRTAPKLRAWRVPADPVERERNLGLALITVGERDGSEALINEGYKRLAAVFPKFEKDADVLASLGMVLFLKDQKGDARKLLRAAVNQRPDAALYEKLAVVERSLGDVRSAAASLERAVALDPGRESAWHLLANLEGRRVLERYLKLFPQSLIAREALARP